jgi:uncharacterized protein with HEPN domain
MFRDALIVRQMVEITDKILLYSNEFNSAECFGEDVKSYDATLMNFIALGELVNKLSDDFRQNHAHIDWRKIYAFRNIIAHDYFGTDVEEIWQIIQKHIPTLREDLIGIL